MDFIQKETLIQNFKEIGIKQNSIVLIHSSLKSIGKVVGGAQTVIDALLSVLGEGGTLLAPTLTGTKEDSPSIPPVFDVRKSPCWTGIIPETVRTMPHAIRSLHPTHSVSAIGAKKVEITSLHQFSTSPCDDKSPYYLNAINNGFILFLGVAQESNTTIHMCEELAKVPYHLHKEITHMTMIGYDGEQIPISNRLHDWEKPETDFNKLDELYKNKSIMTIGKVGNSITRLVSASSMLEYTVSLLKNDPDFLLV